MTNLQLGGLYDWIVLYGQTATTEWSFVSILLSLTAYTFCITLITRWEDCVFLFISFTFSGVFNETEVG